ncbi:hypothetical protein D3C81_2006570 [compost metagenome]
MHKGGEQQLVAAEPAAFGQQVTVNSHVKNPFIEVAQQCAVIQLPVRLCRKISLGPV